MSKLSEYLWSKNIQIDTAKAIERDNINSYLQEAIALDEAYLTITSPTTAERNCQVAVLTEQMIKMARLLVNDIAPEEKVSQ